MRPAMTPDAAIRIESLSKTYAGDKLALDGVSFEVPRGQIFAHGFIESEEPDRIALLI